MTYIPAEFRRQIMALAQGCCEYCRLSQDDSDATFHSEHIVAESHGGQTAISNLALSCVRCNLYKGSNIAAADPLTHQPTFLFHPRQHIWNDHFDLSGFEIVPLTPEGQATVFVLRLNEPERLDERAILMPLGRYPCSSDRA